MTKTNHIDYIEWPSRDVAASTAFFARAFGWVFDDYGPDYQSFRAADCGRDGGFFTGAPVDGVLVVIYAEDIEEARTRVLDCGGQMLKDVFGFPGGRRFEFREPGGNHLAVWTHQADPADA